ncbi:MAG: RNB domain-containing ribonuclease, partial [Quisquiliibacterium sp.]
GILSGRDAQAVRRRAAMVPHLLKLHDVFQVLLKARAERGAIDFDTTETKIVCDAAGRIDRIEPRTRNDAHRLIEECMLAANVCAADFMKRSKHPGLYRVHEGPTPEKLQMLREFLRTVGLSLGGGDDPSPADYAALSVQVRERPDASLLQAMMLRSMQQAIYTPHNNGHFGLAYQAYTHFTSPIRRYPDLMVHRVIKSLLQGKRYEVTSLGALIGGAAPASGGKSGAAGRRKSGALNQHAVGSAQPRASVSLPVLAWEQYGALCSANERRADDASRDVEGWLKCQYMRERVGEQFSGRITGVAPFGVFVTLNDLYVDGLVHVSELGSEYFQYNEATHELRGERTGRRFRLTDELHVQVSRVDLEARRIEFRLVQRAGYREVISATAHLPDALGAPRRKKAASAKPEKVSKAQSARRETARRLAPKSTRKSAGKAASAKRRRK